MICRCLILLTTILNAVLAADRPNIVLIFSDDHAVQAISTYGTAHRPALTQTPNIDRLGAEGIVFDRSYCGNSICAPSRATILTGLHSHANGHLNNFTTFNGEQQTFPKLLQQAGYHTAIRGKWHLKSRPTGFDTYMVYKGQGQYYNPLYITPEGNRQLPGYSVDTTTDLGIAYLKERAAKPDQPFFLAVQFKAPHRPFLPPFRHLDTYADHHFPEPPTLFDDHAQRPPGLADQEMTIDQHMTLDGDLKVLPNQPGKPEPYWFKNWFKGTPEVKEQYLAHYAKRAADLKAKAPTGNALVSWKRQAYLQDFCGTVQAVDENVGRLLDTLDELQLSENTLVIYSSDQGFYLGEHGWYDKRWMYEESYRMPLLMRWPGKIQAGQRSNRLVQNIDYAPTFCAVAGVEPTEPMHGHSLLPIMQGHQLAEWRDSLYYHYFEYPKWHRVEPHYGVSDERYKLIHFYFSDTWELIDLETDPLERKNFIADPSYVDQRNRLYAELLDLRQHYAVPDHIAHPNGKNAPYPQGQLPELPLVFPQR